MIAGSAVGHLARGLEMQATDNFKITIWLGMLTTGMGISATLSNTVLSKTHDCTTIELEVVIDQNASREDNLERLSKQFFQSVNRIEHCDRETQTDSDQSSFSSAADASASASASAAADAPAQPAASSSDASTSPTAAQATPSSSLVGTNLAEDLFNMASPAESNMAGTTPMADPADIGTATGTATYAKSETEAATVQPQTQQAQPDQRLTNGKIPDDISDGGNDSVFEAQIRAAAMAETDPDIQKNLWNEYRRYKGLPKQK